MYNLKSLFNADEIIPLLSNGIIDELKEFGNVQYIKYLDGGFHLNIDNDSLSETDLEEIKEIILNYNKKSNDKKERNKQTVLNRQMRYQIEVDPLTLEAVRLGVSTLEGKALKEEANKRVEQIKKELPKEE